MCSSTGPVRDKPKASIVIPCRNEGAYLAPFLDSVLAQKASFAYEVIIADGMSSDGSRDALETYAKLFPHLHVISNPQKITPVALNLAIAQAQGEFIVRMDVHTEYAQDYLEQCVTLLESRPDLSNVGGPARTKSRSYFQQANQLAYHSPFAVGGAAFHNVDYEGFVDTVPYGCWRKDYLLELGMFDEIFVRNQDDELNLRIQRAGGRIWQSPKIRSWYYPRSSFTGLFKQYMQYGYWKVKVIQKHRLPASIRHLIPGLFVASLAILTPLSLFIAPARLMLGASLGLYCTGLVVFSVLACATARQWRFLPILPIVYCTYHISYGYGFLRGLFDVIRKRNLTDSAFTRLTRSR